MSTVKNKLMPTEMDVAIDKFLNFKAAQGLAKVTLDDMRYRLRKIMREIIVDRFDDLSEEHVIGWFVEAGKELPETGKPRTNPNTRRLEWLYLNQFFLLVCR